MQLTTAWWGQCLCRGHTSATTIGSAGLLSLDVHGCRGARRPEVTNSQGHIRNRQRGSGNPAGRDM